MTRTPLLLLPGVLLDERLFAAQIEGLGDIAESRVDDLRGAETMAGREEMAAAMLAAGLVVLPRCGHLSSLERPGEVTARLRFWLEA